MSDPLDILKFTIESKAEDRQTKMVEQLKLMSNNRTCLLCVYFYQNPQDNNSNGTCWRYPSTPVKQTSGAIDYIRPIVQDYHFCGEYRDK